MKKRRPNIESVTSRAYYQRVIDRFDACAFEWRRGPTTLVAYIGDSDSGSGLHPNFEIVSVEDGKVAHRATFMGMTGNPDNRNPHGYDRNTVSGPYGYADLVMMMSNLSEAA